MNSSLASLLSGLGLTFAVAAGAVVSGVGARRGPRPVPAATLACFVVIAACSLFQLAIEPRLLPTLMRDAALVQSGQPWRLLTSLLVQDGGWAGAAFNLVGLLAIGTVAEGMLGSLQWGIVAAISVVGAQFAALAWQPDGAGNSILDFGLAGAVCTACLATRPARRAFVPAFVALACFVVLLV